MTAPAPERLADLLAAVEMAEGPSGELDDALWFALCWEKHYREMARGTLAFTSSVDAALALVERVLPKATWLLGSGVSGLTKPWCRIGECPAFDANGARLPIAILAALIRALITGAHHAD
jgi:hypothetical protein